MSAHVEVIEVDCPVCSSGRSKLVFSTRDYLLKVSDQKFGVRRCLSCGAGFLSPRPNDLNPFYPKEFYWAWEGAEAEMSPSEIISKRASQLAAKAAWLADLKPGRLLDVGAQKGEFLWYMKERGWAAEGVELDNNVPNPLGVAIRYGDFLTMDIDPNTYDVVTFWAVLEHVENPRAFIQRAAEVLKPGGRLIVVVTNFNSIQSRFFRGDDYPRHLTIFTKASSRLICEQANLSFAVFSTDQSVFGGPLSGGLVYVTKRIFGYTDDEAMVEWKQNKDRELFWTKWRGEPSVLIKNVSRLDRLISIPLEYLFDRMGFGLTLTFTAVKKQQ